MQNRPQTCPLCHSDLAEAQWAGGEAYCACGWTTRKVHARAESKEDNKRATQLFTMSMLFTFGFAGFLYLTTATGQIFLIKQKISFGLAQPSELSDLSNQCLQLGDKACALEALQMASLLQPEKLDLLLDLGLFQMQVGSYHDAAITYKTYLEKGGEDSNVVYRVGKALAMAGDHEEARRYYEKAIADMPGSVNLTATKGLIRLFIEEGKIDEAQALIAQFKEKTRARTQYFNDELRMIEIASSTR